MTIRVRPAATLTSHCSDQSPVIAVFRAHCSTHFPLKEKSKADIFTYQQRLILTHPRRYTPLSAQCHGRRLQVGVLMRLHLWAGQEVVEGSEGVWGPGYRRLIGQMRRADGGAGAAQTLHVMHRSRHQIACRESEGKTITIMWLQFVQKFGQIILFLWNFWQEI